MSSASELAVPNVRQSTAYSCGPASLLSTLRYLGAAGRATERSLMREMGTTAKAGTTVKAMLEAARRRWPAVDLVQGARIEDVKAWLAAGCVPLLLIQAWADDGPPARGYGERLEDGHYVVATSVTRTRVVMADPAVGRRVHCTHRDLLTRWHDLDADQIVDGGAIVFAGVLDPRRRAVGRVVALG